MVVRCGLSSIERGLKHVNNLLREIPPCPVPLSPGCNATSIPMNVVCCVCVCVLVFCAVRFGVIHHRWDSLKQNESNT